MRMSLDWTNLTLKAKDLVSLIVFVGGIVFVVATQNQKLNTIIENQQSNSVLLKEYGLRLNMLEMDQRVLKSQFEAMQNSNRLK